MAERTSVPNPEIAELMNQWFVNIKVDREERPDLDADLHARAAGSDRPGGWPNNVFLTPDLKPFYAGGYFPPEDQEGHVGFPSILKLIHDEWAKEPRQDQGRRRSGAGGARRAEDTGGKPASVLTIMPGSGSRARAINPSATRQECTAGSGGGGTKFPQSPALDLMLTDYRLNGNAETLPLLCHANAMAYGGIYDQLGGGFHRYSTERTWSIPHFEKMLYDNAEQIRKILGKHYASKYRAR